MIWVFGKSEYFCKRGWTEGSINSPGDLPVGSELARRVADRRITPLANAPYELDCEELVVR